MTGVEIAIYLALIAMATERKKQAYDLSKETQAGYWDDFEADRLDLASKTEEDQGELLDQLAKSSVSGDTRIESGRIEDMMKDAKNIQGSDRLTSSSQPKVIKDALDNALAAVSRDVDKRGASKANLMSLTDQFSKYDPEFLDSNTLAQQVANSLKGKEGVMKIGSAEAADSYDRPGDVLGQIADLYGTYMMFSSGGEDPTVIDDPKVMKGGAGGDPELYKYYSHV
tara:strand:- start:1051 stop:1728 length:678 start_codon:yes stop_codon:yes gene_type:complete